MELGRAAPVSRDQSRRGPPRLRRHDARLHLGARVREGGLASRSDSRRIARRAIRALSLGGRSGNLRETDLGPAVVHERGAPLLPRRSPRPPRLRPARDLRRDAGADPGDPRRRGQSSARRVSLARQAVRGPRGERPRGTVGRRDQPARRRRPPLPRPRSSGAGLEVSAHAHRHGGEPGVGDGGGRGEHAATLRQWRGRLPQKLAVRGGPVRAARITGAGQGRPRPAAPSGRRPPRSRIHGWRPPRGHEADPSSRRRPWSSRAFSPARARSGP